MSTLTPEQIAIRQTGIGSSEIAMLCNESQYGTAQHVWLEKMGLSEYEDSEAARWGRMMEPLVAQRYTEETGIALKKCEDTVRHPEYPWMLATPDYMAVDPSDQFIRECKCAFRTAAQWSTDADGAPVSYILQGNHQCGVVGAPGFDLAVFLAPFAEFRIYRFNFDADLFAACLKIASDFWHNHVLTRTPPPADETDATKRALRAACPQLVELAPAPAGADELFRARLEADVEFERAEKAKKLASNRLIECIAKANAEGIRGEDFIATWRANKNGVRSLRLNDFSKKGRAA